MLVSHQTKCVWSIFLLQKFLWAQIFQRQASWTKNWRRHFENYLGLEWVLFCILVLASVSHNFVRRCHQYSLPLRRSVSPLRCKRRCHKQTARMRRRVMLSWSRKKFFPHLYTPKSHCEQPINENQGAMKFRKPLTWLRNWFFLRVASSTVALPHYI